MEINQYETAETRKPSEADNQLEQLQKERGKLLLRLAGLYAQLDMQRELIKLYKEQVENYKQILSLERENLVMAKNALESIQTDINKEVSHGEQ